MQPPDIGWLLVLSWLAGLVRVSCGADHLLVGTWSSTSGLRPTICRSSSPIAELVKQPRGDEAIYKPIPDKEPTSKMSTSILPKDIRPIKRFITTHADDGKETFSEIIPEDVSFERLADGAELGLCYATNTFPVPMEAGRDIQTYQQYIGNPPGLTIPTGTVLRVVDIPPGFTSPMHRTVSLDYGVVLEGEVELLLDSGMSRVMGKGDISIQRGTNHAWKNMSTTSWARMLYVLQPAETLVIGGRALEDNTLGMIPSASDTQE